MFERRDTKKPRVDARVLLVEDYLVVLANDVAFIVALDLVFQLRRARFWIVNGNHLLRGTRLAARVNTGRTDRRKHTTRRAAWTTGNEPHNRSQPRRCCRTHHLVERLRR